MHGFLKNVYWIVSKNRKNGTGINGLREEITWIIDAERIR